MTSTSESSTHSPVETAAVVAHGRVDVHDAVERVRAVAERAGVEVVDEPERAQLAVAVRGIDAMAITFIAPHSLEARPLVVPRGAELTVRNATPDVEAALLVDGHRSGDLAPDRALSIRLGEQRSLLATLPETTFFR